MEKITKKRINKKSKDNIPSASEYITSYFSEITHCLQKIDGQKIALAMDMILKTYRSNKTIFIMGNGGSASISSHFSDDLSHGTIQKAYESSNQRMRAISLTDNVAVLTALANDLSYDEIFVQQLQSLLSPNDLVIVISGSGNSKNVVNAVSFAKKKNIKTIGFLGFKNGGKLSQLVDCAIIVDSTHYGPVEDMHTIISHLIASWLSITIHSNQSDSSSPKFKNSIFSHTSD